MESSLTSEVRPVGAASAHGRRQTKTAGAASDPKEMEAGLRRLTKLKQACAEFESLFVAQLVQAMRATIPEGGYLDQSAGSDLYSSMADQQLSIYLSQGSGLGLGQSILNQVIRREGLEELAARNPELTQLNIERPSPRIRC